MTRTFDLSAFGGTVAAGPALLAPRIVDASGGQACTGAVKLAQRYLAELMPDVGSIPDDPQRGTRLGAALRHGQVRTTADLYIAFASANAAALRRMAAQVIAGDPGDEILVSATLVGATVGGGVVDMTILLTTAAGDLSVILPVATPPGA